MTTVAEAFAQAVKHHQSGNLDQAEQLYYRVLQAHPTHADSHHLLGVLAFQMGQADRAVALIRQALAAQPETAIYYANLGRVYDELGREEEAAACYRQALRIRPDYPTVHQKLGNLLRQRGDLNDAVARYREALRLGPETAEIYCDLGLALAKQANLDEAVAHYQHALRLEPDFLLAHNNLAEVYLKQGRRDLATASFRQVLQLRPDLAVVQSNLLFCLNCDPQADPDALFAEHCRFGRLHEQPITIEPHPNEPSPDRRLRIGYMSPDFRFHALARYFEPVLAHHDAHKVEVICYAQVQNPDAVTARLRDLAHDWCWTNALTDEEFAQRIRNDRVDVLVDLAGHTGNNRLPVFARKPAPVQATWLGYLNTTGLTRIDYRLTDDVMDPPGQPNRDTEELLRLPGGMCCFAPPADAPPVTPLPALQRGYLTFGSLSSLFKLNSGVYDLWSTILRAIPSARMLMFRDTLTGSSREHILRAFTERGIGGERLDLRLGSHAAGYLKIYEEIDIGLDTLPCSGGVTTCESLWMGVPVLTLCGIRPAGRNSAAILSRVGLGDWVAQTPEQLLALAQHQTSDLDRLTQLRNGLRDRVTATLGDAQRFTRELEEAYRSMWRRWCAQQILQRRSR
jgi:protein O-GlcNAc transferase